MSKAGNKENIAESPNPADMKRQALEQLLPEAFTEGRLDIEVLKRTLGEESVSEGGERYRLDWAGKSDAYKVLQTPTTATLRPQRDLSVNFDAAEHVFIEGENLEVLKVLQKAYFGKVKLIYIDPPYNTGSDSFIYPDRFQESKEDYLKRINELEDDGTLMREGFFRKNSRENGHYHSNWLNMMLPRLYIARNLLRDDGFIVVSLDDHEVHNFRQLANEIFGEDNFIASLVFDRNRKNDAKLFSVGHEYMVVYARNAQFLKEQKIQLRAPKEGIDDIHVEFKRLVDLHEQDWPKVTEGIREFYTSFEEDDPRQPLTRFNKVDERGPYRTDGNPSWPGGGGGPRYEVPHPVTGQNCKVPSRGWLWPTYRRMQEVIAEGNINFGNDETTIPSVRMNLFENTEQVMRSVVFSYAQKATQDFASLFEGRKVFDNPKSAIDLQRLVSYLSDPGDLILDFFAGSATTAHATLLSNADTGTERKYLLVQLPEEILENTESGKNALAMGYKTIADLARERIKRSICAINKKADLLSSGNIEAGFKSFELSPTTFRQWRGDDIQSAEELAEQMKMFVKSEKDGAEIENILYELLLKFGQELTTVIDTLEMDGEAVFAIRNQEMLFVLSGFNEAMIDSILVLKPKEVVALDSVFQDSDELKTNFDLQCRDAGIRLTCI